MISNKSIVHSLYSISVNLRQSCATYVPEMHDRQIESIS